MYNTISTLSIFSFKQKFRLTKEVFLEVFQEIENMMSATQRSTKVPAIQRFAAALTFYATGGYQHTIWHERFGQKTVGKAVHEVTKILEQYFCSKWIKFPLTVQDRQAVKLQFYEKFGIPGIVGCVDGTHVLMVGPQDDEHIYVDRLHNHSLNVQLVRLFMKTNIHLLYIQ